MQALPQPVQSLPEKQRAALITLLADDDPAVHETVRNKLLSFGDAAGQWLRPYLLSADPVLRRRATEIVEHLARAHANERFLQFCVRTGEELDLEQGLGLLAQTRYPGINFEGYRALFDQWAIILRERIGVTSDPEQILAFIGNFFFEELAFKGDERRNLSAASCYLNAAVDRRSGNSVTLCAIYLLVARRLGLPIVGISLPGYFLCRYQSAVREFYLDVFKKGKFWTKGDCFKFLQSTQQNQSAGALSPATPRRVLVRSVASLHQAYSQLEMRDEAARMQRYLVALAR
jgi:regulator of sirC expression with transglutaminase-like and TPR domain